ncbi:MAG: hypothetical protein KKC80_08840, partial [Candidatus Margulisbacteria bacterium]|nr:hypothetical protein [Candidatus Margulisiibacteriota bacterium]
HFRDKRRVLALLLSPGDEDNISIEINYKNSCVPVDLHLTVPNNLEQLSEEMLQLLFARALVYNVVKSFITEEFREAICSFPENAIKQLPLSAYFNYTMDGAVMTSFYQRNGIDRPEIFEGVLNLLDWVNQIRRSHIFLTLAHNLENAFLLQMQDAFYDLHSPYRILKGFSSFKSYLERVLHSKGVSDHILQYANRILSPSYAISVSVVDDAENEISFAFGHLDPNKSVVLEFRIKRSIFSKMLSHDFLTLIWLSSQEIMNRRTEHGERSFIQLSELREYQGLTEEEMESATYLQLLYEHYRFTQTDRSSSKQIQILGNLNSSSKKSFGKVLRVIGAHLSSNAQESVQVVWQNVMKRRGWLLGESALKSEKNMVEVTPFADSAIIFVRGDSTTFSQLDWLFILGAMAANGERLVRISIAKEREIITGGNQAMAVDLYNEIASKEIYNPFGCFDKNAKQPSRIDFKFPGGVPAARNPNFEGASADQRRKYINAMLWFSMSDVPSQWQPIANESLGEVKKKYRDMMKAWHSDKGGASAEQVYIISEAQPHWDAVLNMHK